jgi:hypothetical protein
MFPEFIMEAVKLLDEMVKVLNTNNQPRRYHDFDVDQENAAPLVKLLNFVVNRSMDAKSASTLKWEFLLTDTKTTVKKENDSFVCTEDRGKANVKPGARMWIYIRTTNGKQRQFLKDVLVHAKEQLLPFVLFFASTVQAKEYRVVKSPVGKQIELSSGSFSGDLVQLYLGLGDEISHRVQVKPSGKDRVTITIAIETFKNLFAKLDNGNFLEMLKDFTAFIESFKDMARNGKSYTLNYSFGSVDKKCFCYEIHNPNDLSQLRAEAAVLRQVKNLTFIPGSNGHRIITFTSNQELAEWQQDNVVIWPYQQDSTDVKLGYHLVTHLDPSKNRAILIQEMDDMIINIAYLKSLVKSNASRSWQVEQVEGQTRYKYVGAVNIAPFMRALANLLRISPKYVGIASGIIVAQSPNKEVCLTGEAVTFFFGTPKPILTPLRADSGIQKEVFTSKIRLQFINNVFAICSKYRTDETAKVISEIERALDVAMPKNGIILYLNNNNSELYKAGEKLAALRNELLLALWVFTLYRIVPKYSLKAKQQNMLGFEALLGKLQVLFEKDNLAGLPTFVEELDAVIKRQESSDALKLLQEFRSSLIGTHKKVIELQGLIAKPELRVLQP